MLTTYVRRDLVANRRRFLIQAYLNGIHFHMRTVGRFTRPLQEAAPDAKEEIESLEKLVDDVLWHC
jgi:hypothetical protein